MIVTTKRVIKNDKSITEDTIISYLLKDRGITDVKTFLNPKDPTNLSITDFGFKTELKKTLKLLEEIKKQKQMIVVYTDYDADGITGGTILWETLHLLGFTVMPYVPHRKLEGYGFSIKGLDNVKKQYDPALIISVDHGITAAEKITYAKKNLGIPIVVTDHHLKSDIEPNDAFAVFHIPALSGAGVSYFFSKAVFEHFSPTLSASAREKLEKNLRIDYLALASVGSIADLIPLVGPARSITKFGLDAFSRIKREGIRCILEEAGITGKKITPYEVGFVIGPRINAVGRLEHAIDALRLLCTTSADKAQAIASSVGRTNKERQDLVKKAVEEAKQMIEKEYGDKVPNIIALVSKNWHEGIIGLIASKMVEQFYRPVIIMTEVEGFLKGSARSIPSFHVTEFLRSLKKHLVDVGGHTQAAGFTIESKNLEAFLADIKKQAKKALQKKDLEKKIEGDLTIPLHLVTRTLLLMIENLQPFGVGNPQPVFVSDVSLQDARIFGKKNDHLRVLVSDEEGGSLELIAFSKGPEFHNLSIGQKLKIVYQPEIDRWNEGERLRGKLTWWETL
jgi:single-stranded-DNA-specific exonuclease